MKNPVVFLFSVTFLFFISSGVGYHRMQSLPLFRTALRAKGPRDLFKEFSVEPCSPELKDELGIDRWGVWSTRDSPKYKVGVKSPLKVYDCNELSYIISGKMTITPDEGPNKGKSIPGIKPDEYDTLYNIIIYSLLTF